MSSTLVVIFGIVLVISDVANADNVAERLGLDAHTHIKYDRRSLSGATAAPAGGAAAGGAAPGGGAGINVGNCPGAKGDGASDMTAVIQKAWDDACAGGQKLTIPTGIWLHGALNFKGPCPKPITIELLGTLKAKPDATSFPEMRHISLYSVSVTLTGGGTIDGNGVALQKTRKQTDKNLPDSMELMQCPDSSIEGIKFVDAKGFNLKVVQSDNFKAHGLSITCGGETLNTDGIHLARSKNVCVTDCNIAVGDDCISIGDDSVGVTIKNIQCGPGHGVSIGSIGRYPDEKDVRNVDISNVTFIGTSNGARIKTFHNSPAIAVSNITFSDITIKDSFNPVVIDQHYNSGFSAAGGVSKVKISGVTFRNIKGNSMSNMAVSLNCSSAAPCEGITLEGISLTYTGNNSLSKELSTNCENAKATITGSTIPMCGATGGAGAAAAGGAAASGGSKPK